MTNDEMRLPPNDEVRAAVRDAQDRLAAAAYSRALAELDLRQIRDRCTHSDKESWTDDDGDGSFTVERCLVCGSQQDGGLKPKLY